MTTSTKSRKKKKATTIVGLPSKGARIIGTDRETFSARLARGYGNGKPIRTLATENNRSYGSVHQLLIEAGVELRARGGSRVRAN